jgi:hypothetical protein
MSVAAVEPVPGAATGDVPATDDAADAADTEAEETTGEGAEGDPADGAAEPDIEPAAEAKPTEIDEETLRSAAFKFANRTMAAVRRAEKRVEAVKAENATQKQHLQVYAGFVERLQKGDVSALREIGFGSVKEFLDRAANFGDPEKPEPVESRMERLERQLREREEGASKASREAAVAESQRLVFAHVDADKTRWKLTGTSIGHDQLWDALGEYYAMHGDVPDAVVPIIADAVEKHLRAELGIDSGPRQPAKTGASPSQPAAGGGRNSGKTVTNKGTSGAPAPKRYSDDPDERRKQIEEELRVEGLLSGPASAT